MVKESIEKLASQKEEKKTIIAIAHRLSTVKNADKIYVMKGGQVI